MAVGSPLQDCPAVPLLLVRHANALSRSTWEDDDSKRPLSPKGLRQAELLVPILAGYEPQRLLSSPAARCWDTIAPLSAASGVAVESDDRLAEGSSLAVELVRTVAGENVVLCTHGDIIPALLEALASKDGVHLGKNPRVEKASVWVLEGNAKKFRSARYLRPPAT